MSHSARAASFSAAARTLGRAAPNYDHRTHKLCSYYLAAHDKIDTDFHIRIAPLQSCSTLLDHFQVHRLVSDTESLIFSFPLPLGHIKGREVFFPSSHTRGLDIVRERGCLVRWEASSFYLTHHTNAIAMFSNILEEAPEIEEGDTLVFQVRSQVGQSSSTNRSPCGTDVPPEALKSCPRPIKVFYIIPRGESGIAYLEPSTTGRDVISSSGFSARLRLEEAGVRSPLSQTTLKLRVLVLHPAGMNLLRPQH